MGETVKDANNADRLKRLLKLALPDHAETIDAGEWGKQGAPYVFDTVGEQQRLRIEDPLTGDRMGFVGKTRIELLDQLEARVAPKPAEV